MSLLGTSVTNSSTPPSVTSTGSTATCFMAGITDWGPSGVTGVTMAAAGAASLAQAASIIGGPTGQGVNASRTATNATVFDSAAAFYQEAAPNSTIVFSRVLGTGAAAATGAFAPTNAVTFTAAYVGAGGNNLYIQITNNTSNVDVSIQDSAGNVLASTKALASLAAIVTWAATTGLVTATTTGSTLPSTVSATALTGGSNGSTPTLAQWTTAINAFGPTLGPGQIIAPGQTNTTTSGIWSALLTHAQANNRVAIPDETDGASVSTIQSDVSGAAIPSGLQGYGGMWVGNRSIPGIVSGTTRTVPPSAVIAAICTRVDATGNPNLAPAGQQFALQYASSPATHVSDPLDTYSLADLQTLNSTPGVNGFQNRFGLSESYGFVTLLPPTSDGIYWQFNHARLRMAITADLQVAAEAFFGAQIDGQGSTVARFSMAIQRVLMRYFVAGALYGKNANDAFAINTGAAVNTAASLTAGTLAAQVTVRLSPDVQFVQIVSNAIPITQSVTQTANPAQGQ